ncbi:MAG TPA: hypothetical protein GX497_12680 [Bacillus bacterium]|nr:hypothetical protein [Bacillus sp. (in: firmicutes)]
MSNSKKVGIEVIDIFVQELIAKNYSNVKIEEQAELFNNGVEVVRIDTENKIVELKNVSEIELSDTMMIKLDVRGKFEITSDSELDLDKLIEQNIKDVFARPLITQSSLIISFISDKIVGSPLITAPILWSELVDNDKNN